MGMMNRRVAWWVAVCVTVMVSACGGGGGESAEPMVPEAGPASSAPGDVQVPEPGPTESAVAASLTGHVSTDAASVSLTAVGTADWAHWGDGVPGLMRKSTGGSQISAYTLPDGGTPTAFSNSPRSMSWTDGAPDASSSNNASGLYLSAGAFSITVPASTMQRTVSFYVGGWNSGATLEAHLSDGSAPDYVDVVPLVGTPYVRNYTITYRAAADDQTLTLKWTRTAGTGHIDLNGVALASEAPAPVASLSGVVDTSSAAADLTAVGDGDWVHWGDGVPGAVRKASGGNQIGGYTLPDGGTPTAFPNSPRALAWSDGAPTGSSARSTTGLYLSAGTFSITVPAGTTPRTVTFYGGGWKSGATMRAHLSDASAEDYVDVAPTVSDAYVRAYTITYRAAADNQTLTLTWTRTAGTGHIDLNAVALSAASAVGNRAPGVSKPAAQTTPRGQAVTLAVSASDADGDALSYAAQGLPAGLSINSSTGVISGTPTTAADYNPTVTVSDGLGGSTSASFAWSVVAEAGRPAPGSGLNTRPSNTSCVAPARPQGGSGVALNRVFPQLTFDNPVGLFQAPGDGSKWYVTEQQTGLIRSFPNRTDAQPANVSTFLNLSSKIRVDDEMGLLGMAFHPNWPATPQVFVYYSVAGSNPVENRLSRFTSSNGGASLDLASEQTVLRLIKNQSDTNHNGGNIVFGPDGYLYLGTGDGGGGGDPNNNAQNRNVLFGKMLRIDVSGAGGYSIPSGANGNPHAGNAKCTNGVGSAPCPEIFAYGLRNPWRFGFDRSNGVLWAGDVGQGEREEIHVVTRGGNYGWRIREGSACFNPSTGCGTAGANGEPLIDPLVEYGHDLGFAVIGGYVYRGTKVPSLAGRYIFGDYATGRMFAFAPPTPLVAATPRKVLTADDAFLTAPVNITSIAQASDGELYVVGYNGQIYQLQPSSGGIDTIATLLSRTGCVSASDAKQPAAGLIPFQPNAPFWSDSADKQRWLAIPDGTAITPQASGRWSPPNGTVLVKNFKLDEKLIETRLLMRHPDGVWAGYTYEWNEAQTDATRVVGGKTKPIGNRTWIYPSETDCMVCHTQVSGRVLGLETAQLNGNFRYPATGRTANQITTLNTIGVLSPVISGAPPSWPALVDPHGSAGSLEQRARAFLHSNCAQCHQPNGPTPVSLDLRFTTPLASTGACNVAPTQGELGITNPKLIAPGSPSTSVLLSRVNRRDGNAMPPLGSNVVDAESVQVLTQWIQGLRGCR